VQVGLVQAGSVDGGSADVGTVNAVSASERTGRARARRSLFVLMLAACVASEYGCAAKRELVVVSDPPGALVRMDENVVGTTPYTTRFDAYGTRRITLYHIGYRTLSSVEEIDPPWYGRFPFDVLSEVLIPVGWHDRHELEFRMVPESGTVTAPDLDTVLKRAEALRLAEPTGPRPVLPARRIEVPPPEPSKPKPSEPSDSTKPSDPTKPVQPEPVPEIPKPKEAQ
jgi:hypothetical protein